MSRRIRPVSRRSAVMAGAVAVVICASGAAVAAPAASAATESGPGQASTSRVLNNLPKVPAQVKNVHGKPAPALGGKEMPVLGKQAIPLYKVKANGTLDLSDPSPAGCRLQPSEDPGAAAGTIQNPHFSTSVPGAVKVNSFVVCNYPVDSLSNETVLYKLGVAGLIWETQADTTTSNTGDDVLPNQGTYVNCTSSDSSTFTGAAYGTSDEGGVLYEGYGVSPGEPSLACGTP